MEISIRAQRGLNLCALYECLIADDDNDDTDDTDIFLSSFWKGGVILYIIYIMINRIVNNYCLEIINTPLSSLSSSSLSSLAKKGLGEEGRRRDSNCAFDFVAR